MTTYILAGDDRMPVAGHLTYPSPVVPDPRIPMGPNTFGELVWPVTLELVDGGRTRVGFAYITPPETWRQLIVAPRWIEAEP